MNIDEVVERVWKILIPLFCFGFNKEKDEDGFITDFIKAIKKKLESPNGNDIEMLYTGGSGIPCQYKFRFTTNGGKAILTFENIEQERTDKETTPEQEEKNFASFMYEYSKPCEVKNEQVFYTESKSEEGWPIHRTEIQWLKT